MNSLLSLSLRQTVLLCTVLTLCADMSQNGEKGSEEI